MTDFFNIYGDNPDKLEELEKKGEEYLKEQEELEEEKNSPMQSFNFDKMPDVAINQEAFDDILGVSETIKIDVDDDIQTPEPFVAPIVELEAEIEEPEEAEPEFDDSDVNMKRVKRAQKKAMKKRRRKKRVIENIIWTAAVLALSAGLAYLAISMGMDMLGIGNTDDRKAHSFSVPEGSSQSQVISILEENDIIDYPLAFKLYCKLKKADGTFKYGKYTMYNNYNYDTVIDMLQSDGARRKTASVTIPECATISEIGKILQKNEVCTVEQFESVISSDDFDTDFAFLRDIPDTVYRRFEGYLYPDTYEFFCSSDEYSIEEYGRANAKTAVEKMLQSFEDNLPDNYESKISSLSKYGISSLNDVLALASIVDMECNGEYEQMSSVAAIFMNRLVWEGEPNYLGSTPTYYYPDNRYNTNAGGMTEYDDDGYAHTYKAGYEGLPPGAQCSAVKEAIEAVFNPDTKLLGKGYYYFVTDTDANYYYNQTLSEHEATIDMLYDQGKWDA